MSKSNPIEIYETKSNVVVKVYAYKKPRKEEKTWPASKYSIFNIGRQGVNFGRGGVHATNDRLYA